MRPHNLPLVLLGAGLLWFGWFGFNAGSELAVDGIAGLAFMNTQIATAVAAGAWLVVEKLRDGHATTPRRRLRRGRRPGRDHPGLWFRRPRGPRSLIGLLAGAVCAYAVGLKYKLGYDDSLDVVGVHLVGGVIGAVALGFVGRLPVPPTSQSTGLFYGGGFGQLGLQVLGPVAVGALLLRRHLRHR